VAPYDSTLRYNPPALSRLLFLVAVMNVACAGTALPTRPTTVASAPKLLSLEGEAGIGDGQLKSRSRASGEQTIHLAPGESRSWFFEIAAGESYDVSIIYSNGQEGANETLTVSADGAPLRTFVNRDSGDAVEGWNTFISDPGGRSTLGPGRHLLTISSSGGDGCVEIDFVKLEAMP
jgi:hypothetical protein